MCSWCLQQCAGGWRKYNEREMKQSFYKIGIHLTWSTGGHPAFPSRLLDLLYLWIKHFKHLQPIDGQFMIAAGQSCRQLAHKSIWTITDNYLGLWGLIICYGERPVADTPEWTNLNEKQEMKYDVVVVGDLVWHENRRTNFTYLFDNRWDALMCIYDDWITASLLEFN